MNSTAVKTTVPADPYKRASRGNPRFRRLLLNAVIVPLLIMVAVGGILGFQVTRLLEESSDVDQSDQTVAQLNELQKLTIDMETGLRGFLVTGDEAFLEPYRAAMKPTASWATTIDSKSAELAGRLAFRMGQRDELAELDTLRGRWMIYAEKMISRRRSGSGDYASSAIALVGKRQMDQIRAVFRVMLEAEVRDRQQQQAEAKSAATTTLALVAGAALGAGGLLAFIARRQVAELSSTYELALQTANELNQTLERRVADRTAELTRSSTELTEVNRELEAFAYSVSHDLRAPMRHITGFADLIHRSAGTTPAAKSALSEMDLDHLQTIQQTARLAGKMVDDLLSFSRVGRASLREEEVDLNLVVAGCRKDLAPDVAGRDIQWVIGRLPVVRADPGMTKMAIANLIGNAVKYTSKRATATIEIGQVTVAPPTGDGLPVTTNTVTCMVRDNGVGFDMAYAKKLFGVFQRLHRAEDFEGTGIGLANVRRIIQRMRGAVWGEGELDKGATFYFALPAALVSPAPAVAGADQSTRIA